MTHEQRESEIDAELQFHIDMQTQQNVDGGMDAATARTEALKEFGGVAQIREDVRETMRFVWLDDLWRDVLLAARMLRRSAGFTITAVLILGLSIGLSTTIFSFVKAVVFEPLPYANADRLVVIRSVNPQRDSRVLGISLPDLRDWRQQAKSFEGIAAYRPLDLDLTDGTTTQRLREWHVQRTCSKCLAFRWHSGDSFLRMKSGSNLNRLC